MSETKTVLKVEVVNNKMKVTFGTGNISVLSHACMQIQMMIFELLCDKSIEEQPAILTPGSDITLPNHLLT